MTYYLIDGINPFPWKAPKLSVARSRSGYYPLSYPDPEMVVYQETIKEYVRERYPAEPPIEAPVHLTIWYWRSLNFGGQRRNRCDVTNLNKCLEDALQGIVYDNDVGNRIVTGVMVMQERDIQPRILIRADHLSELPNHFAPPAIMADDPDLSTIVDCWIEE